MPKQIDYAALFTKRKDGRYQAVIPGSPPKYLYDRDPRLLYDKVEAAKNPVPTLFKDVAEQWHDHHWEKIRAGTQVCYQPSFERAIDECGNSPLVDVTAGDINKVILGLKDDGKSMKTVSTQRTVFKLIFDYAILQGYTKYNPALSVSIPHGLPKSRREAPEDDVIETIRKNIDKYFGLFPMFLLYTGFRRSEALAIKWGDIDFENETITCSKALEYSGGGRPREKEPKTKAGARAVPLLSDLKSVLKRPKSVKNDEYVFPGKNGVAMPDSAFRRHWEHYCKDSGLTTVTRETRKNKKGKDYQVDIFTPTITPHQLRHAYATILYEAGIDELTAKELLGHADIATTRAIYTHLRQKKRGKANAALNEHFAANYTPLA
ncbi:Site-specific recombinase XerD [Sporobacter termitidis DSM 10068]|uniref:Site-specific recombinase XerD n=1 Tax=Sporobacter termitidis DSM 10068 TaxID=1123282 RepID=A0A1M5ZI50_9FIRM|nr:site-specific integrase [Sporobacter termitidis]SHI23892.1 Site-specific recombinase XerD [Sporobacter termitidis DSM 10068]